MALKRWAASLAVSLALAVPASAEPTVVNLWHVFNIDTDMIHKGIEDFNASQGDIRVEARVVPSASIQTELIKAIATGDVPDLVTIDNPVLASFADQDGLEDLTEDVEASSVIKPENYVKGPWASNVWRDAIYGVPRDANTIALYINDDMFRAAGLDPNAPPKTWDELQAAAGKLAKPGVKGIVFSAIQTEEGPFQWLPFLYQAGGDLRAVNSPEGVAALQFWVDLVKSGAASQDVVNTRQYEAANVFMAGNAAMAISGPWELPRIEKDAKFKWRVAPMPVKADKNIQASALGGYDWAIPAGAEHKDEAFKFIEFMEGPDVLKNGWNTGRLPPRVDVAIDNPRWPDAYKVYSEQLRSAIPRGPHPQWPDISKALQVAIQEALTSRKTAKEALDTAAQTIAPILEKTPL